MRCSNCQMKIQSTSKLNCCPACGRILNEKEQKPGFERTWAMIQEDEFKKNPSQKRFDQTWQWYTKAAAASPKEAIFAARFLAANPGYSLDLKQFENEAAKWEELSVASEKICTANLEQEPAGSQRMANPASVILRYGALHLDPASILSLYYQDSKEGNTLKKLLEQVRQEQRLPSVLEPFYFALRNEYEKARKALKDLYRLEDKEPLVLDCLWGKRLFTGLAGDEKERARQIKSQVEQAFAGQERLSLQELLQALYRPLDDEKQAFDHLYHLPDGLDKILEANKDQWISATRDMLEKDQCLRGIHIALQTLKQKYPRHEAMLDELLAFQYEKAYLRPFKEIEQTDFQW